MNTNERIENIKLEIKYLIENSAFFKVSDVIDLQDGYIIEDILKRIPNIYIEEYAEDYLDMIDSDNALDCVVYDYDLEIVLDRYKPSELYDYLLTYNPEYTINGIAETLKSKQQLISELIFQLDSDSCQEIINQIKNYHKDRVTW